jgi:hypothetical protein
MQVVRTSRPDSCSALARVLCRLLACSLAMSRLSVVCPGCSSDGENQTLADRPRGEHMTLGSRCSWCRSAAARDVPEGSAGGAEAEILAAADSPG